MKQVIDLDDLKISSDHFEEIVFFICASYMAHPNDGSLREKFLNTILLKIAAAIDEDAPGPSMRVVISAMAYQPKVQLKDQPINQGGIAGLILQRLLELHAEGLEAKVNRAQYLVIEHSFVRTGRNLNGDSFVLQGKTSVKKAWSGYACVSHFYAAARILAEAKTDRFDPIALISLAEALRVQAEPLLSHISFWALPDEIKLPPIDVSCTGLPDEESRDLANAYTSDYFKFR